MTAEQCAGGKSTVGDENKEKIAKFISTAERGPGARRTLKRPENLVFENARFLWFVQ